MKFNIVSINDDRKVYKDAIRATLGLEEIHIPSVAGYKVDIAAEMASRGLRSTDEWHAKIGEAGCWLSHFDRWRAVADMDEPLIVFEDDAIVLDNFESDLLEWKSELPSDWDYVSLWVPDNQRQDFNYNAFYDNRGIPTIVGRLSNQDSKFNFGSEHWARVYQGYGMVATMYSPSGGARLVERAREMGWNSPVDCFISLEAHAGRLNGFAPKPWIELVGYDWSQQTTIHTTGKMNAV